VNVKKKLVQWLQVCLLNLMYKKVAQNHLARFDNIMKIANDWFSISFDLTDTRLYWKFRLPRLRRSSRLFVAVPVTIATSKRRNRRIR
jgi:hypothetical protein